MRKVLYQLLLTCIALPAFSQRFTISGYVRDAESREDLISASVMSSRSSNGTVTNNYGFYSLTIKSDSVNLVATYVGYEPVSKTFLLTKDTVIDFLLKSNLILEEVIIKAPENGDIVESSQMSILTVPVEQVKKVPVMLGEFDILKVLQLMPGVQSGNEGTTGLYVRGGGPDQNLMLLDGVPVYNASHLFGFFSIFNTNAIKHVDLIKGGFPARYGERLSSVIDMSMKEGNMSEVHGEVSVGLISAKATVEGPIVKNKSSFIISARRTYIDWLARPLLKKKLSGGELGYYFYDLNAKINYVINKNNRIYYSSYFGRDVGYSSTKNVFNDDETTVTSNQHYGLEWGNNIQALRWNHIYGPRLFANTTAAYSKYTFGADQGDEEVITDIDGQQKAITYGNKYLSGIRDLSVKLDFDFVPNPSHSIRFGINNTQHKFSPGVLTYRSLDGDTVAGVRSINAYEASAYVEDDWQMNKIIQVNAGVRGSLFNVESRWYSSLQPRVSVRTKVTPTVSIKSSFATMTQFIHLLTNAGVGLPTDLWVPSTAQVRPQQAWQAALGSAKVFMGYEFTIEAYYKQMTNLIEYKDGASYLIASPDWQKNIAKGGRGKAYGIEFLIQKKVGATTGWIGYTISKSVRQFEDLNFGKEFPYKFDRRHDISVVVSHDVSRKIQISGVWVFGTGNTTTLPIATVNVPSLNFDSRFQFGNPGIYYGDRNSYRMKSYHRLDLGISWTKKKKHGQQKWTAGVYNAYNRMNPFYIELGTDSRHRSKFIQYSLFPVIPNIAYTYQF